MRLGGARPGGGGCVEDGQGQEERLSRGSSFRKSVSGLVRRVSQRVTRENKGQADGEGYLVPTKAIVMSWLIRLIQL